MASNPISARTFFRTVFCSSSPYIKKSRRNPAAAAFARNIRRHIEWNVPHHISDACQDVPDENVAKRDFISFAALFVNVRAITCHGNANDLFNIYAIRVVKTRVLPVPAPDSTNNGPSVVSTDNFCSGLRFSSIKFTTTL